VIISTLISRLSLDGAFAGADLTHSADAMRFATSLYRQLDWRFEHAMQTGRPRSHCDHVIVSDEPYAAACDSTGRVTTGPLQNNAP
jgi:hypothetical protein